MINVCTPVLKERVNLFRASCPSIFRITSLSKMIRTFRPLRATDSNQEGLSALPDRFFHASSIPLRGQQG